MLYGKVLAPTTRAPDWAKVQSTRPVANVEDHPMPLLWVEFRSACGGRKFLCGSTAAFEAAGYKSSDVPGPGACPAGEF